MRRRLCTELEKEKDFELQISLTLKENMLNILILKAFQDMSLKDFYFAYRIHERNAKEEVKTREHMERRIQAVLSLKTSIASNREKLRTRQVWNKAMAFEAKKQEMKMREAILAEGGNVAKETFLHKRLLEHEKEKQAYREQQKSRKIEIVSQILREKAAIHKRKRSQPCTKAIKGGGKLQDSVLWRMRTWQYIEESCKASRTASVGEISEETPHDVLCESDEDEEERDKVLVEPEFPGLWGQECDLRKVSKEEMDPKQLEKFQTGISHKQIVSGRECKGRTFYSKPSCIHFQDFDVGQIYKKKIVLINASYSVNFCRLVGISEWLKDFISVHFNPPGKMSSGMSCELVVTFKPMINETLEGEVMFMAQTGSFSVPLKCTAKRCILALDKELIDFGSHVVGETISRTINLTNSGALGTRFKVQTSAGDSSTWRATAKPSLGRVVEKVFTTLSLHQINCLGEIGPFSSVKLQILFVPTIPGDAQAEFVIMFDNPDCKPLFFSAIGVSVDVPVWVSNPNVDLKICMYDRLYQECIVIQSRAKATLCLKFEVCRELSKHMELLPKTGYIQAQSSFSLQLKFLPRRSLPEDAGRYFNEETGILEVPVRILIVDKAKKVNFTVHAIVTTSDLEISPAQINFGYCTIYEAVRANIKLTNKSILPQEFGFVGLPEFVEIQPNHGLGIILPLESLTLDIIFKANKAKEYSFELTCKSEINRQFKLSCKAVGVHPPLELSHSLVQFAATALNGVSTATLYVMNSHVSVNPFTHPVPRIGKGEAAPVGPTSFEFRVPEACPVTITPSVGTVLPGKKSLIQVSFRPTLSDQQIREEAVRRLCRAAAAGAEMQVRNLSRHLFDLFFSCSLTEMTLIPGFSSSDAYMAAQAFLRRNFRGRFEKYIIPCFVASGCIDEKKGSENLSYSPYNTLYLELHCPAVAPSVVVTSDNGKNTVNFGDVAVGHRTMKQITIQNISPERVELGFSVLNPNGPFLLVRPVKMLEPGENKTLAISFCPHENEWFFDVLDIRTAKTSLTLSITGRGVMPTIVCSVGEVLDVGYVIAGEKGTSTFKIQNTSPLTLRYSMQLDSLSSTRDKDRQKIPSFIMSPSQRTEFVGTQNYNGLSVFSIFPTEGEIVAGKSQDFTVTFSPDHESLYYSDRLKVVLFGKEPAHVIRLKGAARDHPMFVEGGVPLDVPVESLAVTSPTSPQEALAGGIKCCHLHFISKQEMIRQGHVPQPLRKTLLTLRSDIKETYQILLMAKVVSACAPSK
uniref:Cilia and flagella associated protein 74 n=1 Tax=Calidris pygmaea TaxID=425635 RepID=A0A8C3PPI6_9CHAR